ncbi:MAG: hypothetical protein ACTSPB_00730 [Candidatus Thorarchaeota archaeon]
MDFVKLENVKKKHYNRLVMITKKSTKYYTRKDKASLRDIMEIEWYIYQNELADTDVMWSEFCGGYLNLTLEMVEKIMSDDRAGIISE